MFKIAGVGKELPEDGELLAGLDQLVMEFQGSEQKTVVQEFFGNLAVTQVEEPVLGHSDVIRSHENTLTAERKKTIEDNRDERKLEDGHRKEFYFHFSKNITLSTI